MLGLNIFDASGAHLPRLDSSGEVLFQPFFVRSTVFGIEPFLDRITTYLLSFPLSNNHSGKCYSAILVVFYELFHPSCFKDNLLDPLIV